MLIVDSPSSWEKGTPSPPHRQEPFSAEEAVAAMDQAGVGRALLHPVLWDPDSNELAIEAVRKYPDRFAIMGWFFSTIRMAATSSRGGKSGRACSGCASISTSGTSGSG